MFAIWWAPRRPTAPERTHKRLNALATISILTPAIARLRYIWGPGPLIPIVGTCLFVVACLVYDRLAHGRVHPAFLWGGILVMVTLPARFALGRQAGRLAGRGPIDH